MSSFTTSVAHGIQSHHSASTANVSTSSISISPSYSTTPSSSINHNNNLPQNYQQTHLHHHHNSPHSQFQSHQGQSPPLLQYSTDISNEHHQYPQQQNSVSSNKDGTTTNIVPLSPTISGTTEPKYLSSPSSTGTILPNTPHIPTSTIEQLGPITPPASGSMLNLHGAGHTVASTVSSQIQLPQTPEDPTVLQQQPLIHPHVQPPQHDLLSSNHPPNPHVSVHQHLASTIQQQHHGSSSGGNSHPLAAHQSGGGLIHTSSSMTLSNRHSNSSTPLRDDEDENPEHAGDLADANSSSAIDHGPSSGGAGRLFRAKYVPLFWQSFVSILSYLPSGTINAGKIIYNKIRYVYFVKYYFI